MGQGWDRVAGRVGQGGRVGIGPWFKLGVGGGPRFEGGGLAW